MTGRGIAEPEDEEERGRSLAWARGHGGGRDGHRSAVTLGKSVPVFVHATRERTPE